MSAVEPSSTDLKITYSRENVTLSLSPHNARLLVELANAYESCACCSEDDPTMPFVRALQERIPPLVTLTAKRRARAAYFASVNRKVP